ncbi:MULTISPECIES: hypothetical protein [unclassified Mesorhizobium]|uniref:hypothetical protein n=1 Tax=unclassified Mesorhizobium TaxID=325217 RepID=UPI000FD38D69|nr:MULTISPECIES: hypothetical protein [unclassified Mesorhizobium]RVB71239.1 hypothetical protein EN885_32855 [Mesorhizobium sp. M6A.T.Cr.TU.014.01.1.1]RWP94916.1 MAG: hypothetical protein EOR91_33000 [Mesorhizobium sp.]RWP97796.1 MAG: hypothetical protein EOR90_27465 [Mesorhizobium sp.]
MDARVTMCSEMGNSLGAIAFAVGNTSTMLSQLNWRIAPSGSEILAAKPIPSESGIKFLLIDVMGSGPWTIFIFLPSMLTNSTISIPVFASDSVQSGLLSGGRRTFGGSALQSLAFRAPLLCSDDVTTFRNMTHGGDRLAPKCVGF